MLSGITLTKCFLRSILKIFKNVLSFGSGYKINDYYTVKKVFKNKKG